MLDPLLAWQFGQAESLADTRLRSVIEEANDAILILDPGKRILAANRRSEDLLRRPRGEIVGHLYDEFVVREERPEAERRHQELLRRGRLRVESRRYQRPDGSTVSVEASASLVRVEGESLIVIILHDVTEQEEASSTLRAAQERLEHVLASSPAVLYTLKVMGEDLVPSWVSSNIERLTGYAPAEVSSPDWWTGRVHPQDLPRLQTQVATLISERHVGREYRFRRQDGSYMWVRDEQILIGKGAAAEVVGSWSDVTALKNAEAERAAAENALRESAEQYRLLFEANPQPMWVFDADTLAILAVNEAALRVYGYSRDEFLAMTIKDVRPPEEVPLLLERMREFKADHFGDAPRTWKHRKKDGTVFEVEAAGNRIVFEGRPAFLMLFTDVTEKRSLEAQLAQVQRLESLGRLAGGVAHDFNNLLGIISGYAELLQRRAGGEPRVARYAADIASAAERAASLTGQLLAFSRRQILQPRLLDLNAVVSGVEKMLRRLIGEDVALVTALAPDLARVRADPGQMEQVLMNLAVNARDAMPRGGRLIVETGNCEIDEACCRLHPDLTPGRYAMLAVTDTGHGMTPEVRARIFEPFFTTKQVGQGTGLGLATVHGIVRQSGGHTWVYSEVGRGSTFKVLLPQAADAAAAPEDVPAAALAPAPGSEVVLLVEDEGGLRQLIQEALRASGYEVLTAGDGREALAACERHGGRIDLLLTDTVMPGMCGRELADRLQATRPHTQVLFMSGYTDDAVVLRGVLAAETAFLQKPFTLDALERKIRQVLGDRAGH